MEEITSNDLGIMLKARLKKENYDVVKISRWSFSVYLNNMHILNDTLQEVLLLLARMEDEPEFEYSKEKLDRIAEMLINEDKDILEKM